jgi:hypothetical protein
MRVLIGCECSGVVRDAFIAKGHDAWSCDLVPTDKPGPHYTDDIRAVINFGPKNWDLAIFHPPCTYLLRAGYHWCNRPDRDVHPLKGEPRRKAMKEASKLFQFLLNAPIPRICLENPVPISHANLPPYTQLIQPWMFGHGETKATCLWLKNLPPLIPTVSVEPDLFMPEGPKERENRIHKMGPSPERSKLRSVTYSGIAKAMADQWGTL